MRILFLLILVLSVSVPWIPAGPITIGKGPSLGSDHAFPPNEYFEEFQDWTHADCRALDKVGGLAGDRYDFADGYDDSRDLMAFYARLEDGKLFLRADFFDLALGAENNNLDLYVAIDCAMGGQEWMPDNTNVKAQYAWERCVALYKSGMTGGTDFRVYRADWTEDNAAFLGSYWHSQLDAVEFALTQQTLRDAGWDGVSTIYFTVMTTANGRSTGDGKSKATDCFLDDDRGFSDGVIHGAIASNGIVGRAKWASIAHGNQSVNKNNDTRVHIFDPNNVHKTGFIRTLDTHEIFNVPINLHLSGSLITACRWAVADPDGAQTTEHPLSDGPAFLRRVGAFVDGNQSATPGALVGGVLAEHIMPYFEGDVNNVSINLFTELMVNEWGLQPEDVEVMHVPERVIRSQPTDLAPLTGLTFADIAASPYRATVLDEVTHYHWWFDAANTQWSGNGGGADKPAEHKIHKINGVYCFLINDREDQQKFGNHDGGATLDSRYSLLDKARQGDQAQLTLVFDDWEALAGKSFDPGSGQPVANNNQMQYQNTVRWLANHPFIEIVTLKEILHRATNAEHPLYNSAWVIDHGSQNNLSLQTYEWLKHATENSYHFWYYNKDAGFAGNEQSFYDLVPVITGPQGDYHTRFPGRPFDGKDEEANSVDGPKLPSGMSHGDLNTPGTLMRDTWDAVAAAPENAAAQLARWTYCHMIYETAWHEEDQNDYANTTYQNPFPFPDTSWDGVNTWALRLQNHVRKAAMIAAAAHWIEDICEGRQGAATVVRNEDLDFDGEAEPVLKNNRVWAAFERYGGRCVCVFVYDPVLRDAHCILGAPVANPSAPGEEEYIGTGANRCSTFKEMNTVQDSVLADIPWSITTLADALEFTFTRNDTQIVKRIQLPAGKARLVAEYEVVNLGSRWLYTRIGASPNLLDLMKNGQENLLRESGSDYRALRNTRGGEVTARLLTAGPAFNDTPADAGYRNRNLALTEQIEIMMSDNAVSRFELIFAADTPPDASLWMAY